MQILHRIVVLLMIACSAHFLIAQTPTGIVQGTVTDSSGDYIQGASISITHKATTETRSNTPEFKWQV
jgi:hypothetical protein